DPESAPMSQGQIRPTPSACPPSVEEWKLHLHHPLDGIIAACLREPAPASFLEACPKELLVVGRGRVDEPSIAYGVPVNEDDAGRGLAQGGAWKIGDLDAD